MQLANLAQATTQYDHIYLSPHLDDAPLSAGGAIALQRSMGEHVLVITLCTGIPDPAKPLSDLANEFHASWGLSPAEVVPSRLREEAQAMQTLDADYHWVGTLDAIYRYPSAYHSRDTLFSLPAEDDPLLEPLIALFSELRSAHPNATFYAPLGIGSHVDHLITHRAAHTAIGNALVLYEDFPYVAKEGAREARLSQITLPIYAERIAIDATIATKIASIDAYASQLGELFRGRDGMVSTVNSFFSTVAPSGTRYGEQRWRIG